MNISKALRNAALKWELEQINFVVGNHGSVVECDFNVNINRHRCSQ